MMLMWEFDERGKTPTFEREETMQLTFVYPYVAYFRWPLVTLIMKYDNNIGLYF